MKEKICEITYNEGRRVVTWYAGKTDSEESFYAGMLFAGFILINVLFLVMFT